jgi:pSer/pThr/pTyr-binding forkhead associated (FHA) protein
MEFLSLTGGRVVEVKFIVVGGKNAGREIPITGPEFLIGRADDCQMRPQSDRVSRRHCIVRLDEALVTVRDCGSKNGTFVNDERLEPQSERELKGGDKLKVGPLEFEVQMTVSVSGKKKPKVRSVQEAAARFVETTSGEREDADVANWLDDDEDEEEVEEATGAKAEAKAAEAPSKDSETRELPPPAADDTSRKKPPTTMFGKGPQQPPAAGSSRDAAADMLKQFFHRNKP